jgi:hypothetical protein
VTTTAIIATPLAALFLLGVGGAGGYALRERMRPGTCDGCGHPLGCRSSFGECTRKIRVRAYTGGRRSGFKYEPCKCRDHSEPSALSVLTKLAEEVPTQ